MRFLLPVLLALPFPAFSQQLPCAPRERVLEFVMDQRGETRLATGEARGNATIELFAGPGGGWTLLLNLPDGRSCLLANGGNFRAEPELQPARGNPT
ncbi:hypothetical protein [Pararhodobacter marinus]|uniref:Uncharacterized protein n=1 Tax=Pararhodobacter marinus TaxID=2184063 RepID=A0A2U2CJ47_9RHOB|nr:hypothetical protein [Pararhodobacter marinus]PWE31917.1 hypothetical protein C4N9_02645 [Pararhodobacter marinus]